MIFPWLLKPGTCLKAKTKFIELRSIFTFWVLKKFWYSEPRYSPPQYGFISKIHNTNLFQYSIFRIFFIHFSYLWLSIVKIAKFSLNLTQLQFRLRLALVPSDPASHPHTTHPPPTRDWRFYTTLLDEESWNLAQTLTRPT